jgi:pre-mRNA-splicing factor ISY1
LAQLRDVLGLAADDSTVVIPDLQPDGKGLLAQNTKRKVDDDTSTSAEKGGGPTPPTVSGNSDQAFVHAQLAASYIPFLSSELLMPPKMPTRAEMEQILLDLRKKALMDEYFGSEPMAIVS